MKNLVVFMVLLLLVSACKHKEEVSPMEPQKEEKTTEATKPAEPEEVQPEVIQPVQPPAPVEELPEDIAEINKKGYLKDVFFDFDKYDLKEEARQRLYENALWLKKHPNIKVMIEGHCDERGTRNYNLALGEKRANAAKEYLVSLGIDAQRIDTISYGEDRPFALCHNESCWWQNRRAHFVVVAK